MTRKPFLEVSPKTQQLRTRWKKHREKYSARFEVRITPEQKEFCKKHGNVSDLFREFLDSLMNADNPDESVRTNCCTGSLSSERVRHEPNTTDTEAHLEVRSSSSSLVSISSTTRKRAAGPLDLLEHPQSKNPEPLDEFMASIPRDANGDTDWEALTRMRRAVRNTQ